MTTGGRVADKDAARLLSAADRAETLLGWLAAEGRLDVADAAGRLGVAQETVRRDLRLLESRALLVRVHGGAVGVDTEAIPSAAIVGLDLRTGAGAPNGGPAVTADDRGLVERLWERLPHSGTLLLGTGRLTLELAQVIATSPAERARLTVVTNSLDIGLVLSRASGLSVYNIGGTVSPLTRAQEGDWALNELHRLHTEVSVVCPAGISVDRGMSQPTPASAAVSQAEVAAGEKVIALVEEAALGRPSFVTFAELSEIQEIAVAGRPSPSALAAFNDRGIPCLGSIT